MIFVKYNLCNVILLSVKDLCLNICVIIISVLCLCGNNI